MSKGKPTEASEQEQIHHAVNLRLAEFATTHEERIRALEHRLDLLYRYTVGDRTGWRYPLPSSFLKDRGDEFPPPDYDMQGGPRKPQEKT